MRTVVATLALGACVVVGNVSAEDLMDRVISAIEASTKALEKGDAAGAWDATMPIDPNVGTARDVWNALAQEKAEDQAWVKEQWFRVFRDHGLRLCEELKADARCTDFLMSTLWTARVEYWRDPESATTTPAPIDREALTAWEQSYFRVRARMMGSSQVTAFQKAKLQRGEIWSRILDLSRSSGDARRPNLGLLTTFLDTAIPESRRSEFSPEEMTSLSGSDEIIASNLLRLLDGDKDTELLFLGAMKSSPQSERAIFASGRERVARLRSEPLELELPLMGGGTVDFRELRGKVVLVDMWYNFCSVCIASMPSLQKLYKRYQPQGLEVVGLWTEASMHPGMANYATAEKQVDDARAILKKQGATWPNAVVKQEEFWPAYAISGMPTLWLLDQKGRLVTAQAEGVELESEIRRLLGLPPVGSVAE